jgi:hypothetical protein
MAIQPTKARFRSVYIKGVDVLRHVSKIEVYEDICKQFKTGKLTVIDNNDIINNLKLVGSEEVTFAFDNLLGDIYQDKMNIVSVSGESYTKNKRSTMYTIHLRGEEYFRDKANIVQHSFKNNTATAAVNVLHSKFFKTGLQIKVPSLGPMALETSHIISSLNPITAIQKIKNLATYAQYKTGSTLYFRDVSGHVVAPLEYLFDTLAPQQTFVQKATWGSNWQDVFGAYNAIIEADTVLDERGSAGRTTQDVASSSQQGNIIFDMKSKSYVVNKILGGSVPIGKLAGSADAILNNLKDFAVTGGIGGKPNFQVWDTTQTPKNNIPSLKTPEERLYQDAARNGPTVKITVPIQTGIKCTVGKGIFANLLPPSGDMQSALTNSVGGLMMVTELVHTVYNNDQSTNGTTTMKCISGGYNT